MKNSQTNNFSRKNRKKQKNNSDSNFYSKKTNSSKNNNRIPANSNRNKDFKNFDESNKENVNFTYSKRKKPLNKSNKDYDKTANLIKRYGSIAFSYILKNDSETFFKNFKFECVLE